ncbi:MAG: SH3 domain-containing protein [Clostridia bacterium]|nr:SH3 domain-containing protein [Clostridia bacterium]
MKKLTALLLVAVMLAGILPVALPGGTAKAETKYMTVVGGWLRLRSQPNFYATTLASYYTGTTVEVIGTYGEWYNVKTPDSRTGYMYGKYLSSGGSKPVAPGTAATIISANGQGVKLRTGPSKGYGVIGVYPVGTAVTVLSSGTYWSYIRIGTTTGYMMSEFLSTGKKPVTPTGEYNARVISWNGYGVRLRSGPSTGNAILGVYAVGTPVTVLQHGATWDYIRIGSRVGYMMNKFLTTDGVDNTVTACQISNESPKTGDVLTVYTRPANAMVAYEWMNENGVLLSTDAAYKVQGSDAGHKIYVKVTGIGLFTGSATSKATAAVVATKTLFGAFISNTSPVVGDTLYATTDPSDANCTYMWCRAKTGVTPKFVGTGSSYKVKAEDEGYAIAVVAIAQGDWSGEVDSAYTNPVTAPGTGITGVAIDQAAPVVGDTLTCTVQPAGAKADILWTVGTDGFVGDTYTVKTEDAGKVITVSATGKDGYTGTKVSAPVTVKTADKVITAVVINESIAHKGDELTFTTTPAGADCTVEWLVDGAAAAATATYTVKTGDVGKPITVKVTGKGEYTGSAASTALIPVPDSVTDVVTGVVLDKTQAKTGEVLTATVEPAMADVVYSWTVGGAAQSETTNQYTVKSDDIGKEIQVTVTGQNTWTGSKSAKMTAGIKLEGVVITGTPKKGETLTAVVTPAGADCEFTWKVGDTLVSASSTYVVDPAYEGKTITVTATGAGDYCGEKTGSVTVAAAASDPGMEEPGEKVTTDEGSNSGELGNNPDAPGIIDGGNSVNENKENDTPEITPETNTETDDTGDGNSEVEMQDGDNDGGEGNDVSALSEDGGEDIGQPEAGIDEPTDGETKEGDGDGGELPNPIIPTDPMNEGPGLMF